MGTFLIQRLMLAVITLVGVSILIFLIMRVLPGDVALYMLVGSEGGAMPSEKDLKAVRDALGLEKPLIVQYGDWMRGVLSGNMGQSYFRATSVGKMFMQRGPLTLEIAILAVLLSWVIGVPLGLVSGLRRNSLVDYVSRSGAIVGLAAPNFWLAVLLLVFLMDKFNWYPPLLFVPPWENPWTNLQQVWAPSVVLALALGGYVARMTRSSVLEVVREDFVRTAWAKGLAARTVVIRHMMKISLLPVITLSSVQLAALLGGTVAVETVFGINGLGFWVVRGVLDRDVAVVQSLVLLFAVGVVLINLMMDVAYGWLDPRIRVH